jgi:adenylate cyclase
MALGLAFALAWIASTMTKPISRLVDAMKQVQDNQLTIQVKVTSQDEIGFLSLKFNRMILSLRRSRDELTCLVDASRQFVPYEFLQMLGHSQITEVSLGDAQHKSLTVLFLDIRDFTSLSANMTAEQVLAFINLLNQYLIPPIQACDGFVDKYIGDAIMAIFPNSPDDAVNAAKQLMGALDKFNADRPLDHLPEINLGIGINWGEVVMGTVGTQGRMDTTVIGDTVNLASRMESLTKTLGVRILMPVGVYRQLLPQTISALEIKRVGEVPVKGIVGLVETYGVRC